MRRYHFFLAVFVALSIIFVYIGPIWGQEIERININKASAAELAELKTLGVKYAVRIVAYRQKYGPFKLTEEIMEVRGIGPHTYDRIKEKIIAQ